MPDQLHVRSVHVRAVDQEARTVSGIAVPWDQPVTIRDWAGEYTEQFARGSVRDSDDALLYWRHDEPIGRLTAARDTDAGWEITASISSTPRGEEAYTLLRDGVIRSFSVGFRPVRSSVDEETGAVTREEVEVREVSVVPMPAYDGAAVTDVRHQSTTTNPRQETDHMTDVLTRADLDALRTEFQDLDRGLDQRLAGLQRDEEPAVDTRSAGEVLHALVRGDEATVASYDQLMQQRADEPATSADAAPRPTWVGDLTRIIADSSILPGLFSTGTLPATGNKVEYGQLKSNTVTVEEQTNEGDPLTFGKVSIENKSADVHTYGGYSTLTRQAVERSSANLLNHTLNALALAAAKRRNVGLRAYLAELVAAQRVADTLAARKTVTVDAPDTYLAWVSGIVDAAGIYEDQALPLDGLLADKSTFKELAGLHDSAGRPLMTVYGTGTNAVGEVNVKNIDGNLAGVTVKVDARQKAEGAAFYNRSAIKQYNSPLVSLTDGNVVNLTNAFSVYFYAALAAEVPDAIVPVVAADPTA
ncbi:HK97 family phage prohead protease [Curtobacterium sp. VKM Ac-2861]|uniref:HK97 family phage prohead protease n=1 Tax=Curtobacterium sp. VKM Ac-2861 TaxID=2739016 RepID=UPI0015653ABF|nr:HK97 family phage prohead protease [Curtobacterium sp. VKM Ac-2861]